MSVIFGVDFGRKVFAYSLEDAQRVHAEHVDKLRGAGYRLALP